jgi:O-antigen ligase
VRAAAVSALAALVVAAVVLIVSDSGPRVGTPRKGTNTERLASVQSNRYDYWRVAVDTFADHPLKGAGSGAFGVEWLQRRTVAESVRDAHSLWLETAAELGLLGLAALAALVGGLVLAALRGAPAAALGALAAWAVFASMDWAWEMPTLSLIALILAGMVLAAVERDPEPAEPAVQQSRAPAEAAAAA